VGCWAVVLVDVVVSSSCGDGDDERWRNDVRRRLILVMVRLWVVVVVEWWDTGGDSINRVTVGVKEVPLLTRAAAARRANKRTPQRRNLVIIYCRWVTRLSWSEREKGVESEDFFSLFRFSFTMLNVPSYDLMRICHILLYSVHVTVTC